MCVQIREGLDWDQAVKELLQAVDYLRNTGSPKVTYPAAWACSLQAGGAKAGGGDRVWVEGARGEVWTGPGWMGVNCVNWSHWRGESSEVE